MPQFVKSVHIGAPVQDVFAFHERQDALQLLSPAFPPVRLAAREGDGLQPGTRVRLCVGPLPWVARHTVYERNRLFIDEQETGPFTRWLHRHEFEAVAGGTLLTDRITYELPGGVLSELLFGWAVRLGLRQMFAHRHATTRRIVEAAANAGETRRVR